MDNFEKMLHEMFDSIWDCEIDHQLFQDTVGELMEAVIEAHKIEKIQSEQQLIVSDWISVNDKLPFEGESSIVYCYCHDVVRGGKWAEVLCYNNGGVWCKPTGETFNYKVLAWYPLPNKPYREKKV